MKSQSHPRVMSHFCISWQHCRRSDVVRLFESLRIFEVSLDLCAGARATFGHSLPGILLAFDLCIEYH